MDSITQNSKNAKRYLPHNIKSLSLKVNSRFCLKLEFSLGMKFYLSRI